MMTNLYNLGKTNMSLGKTNMSLGKTNMSRPKCNRSIYVESIGGENKKRGGLNKWACPHCDAPTYQHNGPHNLSDFPIQDSFYPEYHTYTPGQTCTTNTYGPSSMYGDNQKIPIFWTWDWWNLDFYLLELNTPNLSGVGITHLHHPQETKL